MSLHEVITMSSVVNKLDPLVSAVGILIVSGL